MSDSNRDGKPMPITDEIFAAADRQGLGLVEYLRHNYSNQRMDQLESRIKQQLASLNSDISDFMQGIELPQIESNLKQVGETKLEVMQTRLMTELHAKQEEFDQMLGMEGISAPVTGPLTA